MQRFEKKKKGVKVIKLPCIYVFVEGEGLSVLGSVKLRISMFCSVIPGRILIFGRNFCSPKSTASQRCSLPLPTTKSLKDEICSCETRLDVFLSFSQQDGLGWNLFCVPGQNYILCVSPKHESNNGRGRNALHLR